MSFFRALRNLFGTGRGSRTVVSSAVQGRRMPAPAPRSGAEAVRAEPTDGTGATGPDGASETRSFPAAVRGVGNSDRSFEEALEEREDRILARVGALVDAGNLELPQMPATSMTLLDLTHQPAVRFEKLVEIVERDPVLSSELLRAANSAFFGGSRPAETLDQAVVRLGLRNLRAMIFGLSMKNMVSRTRGVEPYAAEVWRQATSMARIARHVASESGDDADRAFLIGLLHDVGKIPLLDLLGRAVANRMELRRALVAKAFAEFHERVGADLARQWKLPDELAAVAGRHHAYRDNAEHPRGAALASLAHGTDLFLSIGDEEAYFGLVGRDEFDVLGVPTARRKKILEDCMKAYVGAQGARASERPAKV